MCILCILFDFGCAGSRVMLRQQTVFVVFLFFLLIYASHAFSSELIAERWQEIRGERERERRLNDRQKKFPSQTQTTNIDLHGQTVLPVLTLMHFIANPVTPAKNAPCLSLQVTAITQNIKWCTSINFKCTRWKRRHRSYIWEINGRFLNLPEIYDWNEPRYTWKYYH